jgi:hypothetical protein
MEYGKGNLGVQKRVKAPNYRGFILYRIYDTENI